ncbi:hypothetical protein BV22DRAFT_1070111 [Leucogyrophana mollusca]|uniref:Uncharacterized protein n=1 Tax=Leucogyrophana mollusca TaxID=85980 RepID=A0ACB8BCR8_9AGAM|nr:hypothetical protein BV22DRAFT_1070111 [Leucogyrophana mollusca]
MSSALDLKNKGNEFFRTSKFVEAAKCYREAEIASPNDAVYPSNLSAALYESGQYAECIEPLCRSWGVLQDRQSSLALKLSNRLVKALLQGVLGGSLSIEELKSKSGVIRELESVAQEKTEPTPGSVTECVRMWQEWREVERASVQPSANVVQARNRLTKIPIFKSAINPSLPYYSVGNDAVMSLIDGWEDGESPLKLNELSHEDLSQISILFGGVGDARHVFGTLIGMHRAHKKLSPQKRASFHAHLTLLDIQDTALARDLCILMLINDLLERSDHDKITQVEIKATIFYVYVGIVMPSYCWDRLLDTIKKLIHLLSENSAPTSLPSWLYVDASSKGPIIDALQYWATETTKSAAGFLRGHPGEAPDIFSNPILHGPGISSEYKDMLQSGQDRRRTQAAQALDALSMDQLRQFSLIPAGVSDAEGRKLMAQQREELIDALVTLSMDGTSDAQLHHEVEWYKMTKAFVPPPELWPRHPGFEKYSIFKQPRQKFSQKAADMLASRVLKSWKPNLTLCDRESIDEGTGQRREYPDVHYDAFGTVRHIESFNDEHLDDKLTEKNPDSPAFLHVSRFFDAVVSALRGMAGHVKLEILAGDLSEQLSKMRFDPSSSRADSFPKTYTRAWLSNVPDYTHGLLNMAVYLLPNLQCTKHSEMAANSLVNTGMWKNGEEFCHNYTLLHPRDLPRYLGCRLISNDPMQGLLIMGNQPLPRPLAELASRDELTTWLSRVLLDTLLPGHGGKQTVRARMPNNLASFFGLLLRLQEIGYPGHWLSEFLTTILHSSLVTDVVAYMKLWPIPLSEIKKRVPPRRLRLDPWYSELETLIATAQGGIPFSVSLPKDFVKDHTEIGFFETPVTSADTMLGLFMPFMVSGPIADPVVSLIFYKSQIGMSADSLVSSIPAILEGRQDPPRGTVHIVSATQVVGYPPRILRWRMSEKRVLKMKQEQWSMVGYRTDTREPFTQPVFASSWKNV